MWSQPPQWLQASHYENVPHNQGEFSVEQCFLINLADSVSQSQHAPRFCFTDENVTRERFCGRFVSEEGCGKNLCTKTVPKVTYLF